jgi:hypothetical protein
MGITGFVLRERMRYEITYASLKGYLAPPAGANVAARSLTPQQARDMVLHYWVNKLISLEDIPTCDSNGKVLTPKVGSRVRVRLDNIAGVKFVADQHVARSWTYTGLIQMRTIVLIVRFAQFLKHEWNASVIY